MVWNPRPRSLSFQGPGQKAPGQCLGAGRPLLGAGAWAVGSGQWAVDLPTGPTNQVGHSPRPASVS